MRDSLASILGASLDDRTWSQASLPVSLGGLGLRNASHHSAASYTVSITHSVQLSREVIAPLEYEPDLDRALDILNGLISDPLTLDEIEEMPNVESRTKLISSCNQPFSHPPLNPGRKLASAPLPCLTVAIGSMPFLLRP